MVSNGIYFTPKNAKEFCCEKCNFVCSKQSDWNRHILTRKHTNDSILVVNGMNVTPKHAVIFECKCGKTYKWGSGYYRHKKTCSKDQCQNTTDVDKNNMTQILVELIMSKNQEFISEIVSTITQSNKEVMAKMVEMMPKMGNQSNNNNNNTNSNNNFNIQMFLNEHCKNAMNLTDFIESLPITSDTYDSTIENGLTKTITTMITNGLNQLDILERPIHCTDASRKTLYVKDDNIWEKDNELHHIMKGIKDLSLKQRTMINKWQDANMGWDTTENLQSRMTKLIFNSMTTIENDEKETGKIIRAISKNVYLDNDTRDQYNQLK